MTYQITKSEVFKRNVAGIRKSHYKKDKRGYAEFEKHVADFLADVEKNGPNAAGVTEEPWPKNTADPDWQFCKHRFKMPRLKGAAGLGRIMFSIHKPLSLAYPILAYTHKDYGSRPSDREIQPLLRQAMEDVQTIIKQQQNEENKTLEQQ